MQPPALALAPLFLDLPLSTYIECASLANVANFLGFFTPVSPPTSW